MVGFDAIGMHPIGGEGDVEFSANFHIEENSEKLAIIQTAQLFELELIKKLQQFPEDLRTINRRRFEHLIAELFNGFGYEVELTQQTRDGGKDIIAIKRSEIDQRYLIECKRPDPGNPVSVKTVRELFGVKVDEGATKAILATTTYFSPDAKIFSEKHKWELELRDYNAIRGWIERYLLTR